MTPEQEALREKVMREFTGHIASTCCHRTGGVNDDPKCECRVLADAAIAVVLNWQPIETAPRDGTPFLGWNGHWRGVVQYFVPAYLDDPEWVDETTAFIEPPPTHWMPLPPPPALNPSGSPAS